MHSRNAEFSLKYEEISATHSRQYVSQRDFEKQRGSLGALAPHSTTMAYTIDLHNRRVNNNEKNPKYTSINVCRCVLAVSPALQILSLHTLGPRHHQT